MSPAPTSVEVRYAPPRLRSRTMRIGSSGLRVRSSRTTNAATSSSPTAMKPSAQGSVQPLSGMSRVGLPCAAFCALRAAVSAAFSWLASATRVKP